MSNEKKSMTPSAAKRIQRSEANKKDGQVSKDSFAARATRAAAKNAKKGKKQDKVIDK